MDLLNKRNFLKVLGLVLGGAFFNSAAKATKEVKLTYRIDFPEGHTLADFNKNKEGAFVKGFNKKLITHLGLSGRVKTNNHKTSSYVERTLTFSSQQDLDLYLKAVSQLDALKNQKLLTTKGYQVSYKIIS